MLKKIIGYTRRGTPVYPIAGGSPTAIAQPAHAGVSEAPGRVPFVKGSYQFAEKFFTDTVTTSTSQQAQTPHNVTPGGFLRGVFIEVNGTGGVLGTAVVGTDFPFSLIASITLEDINGAPIIGPLTGWELFALNKYCGLFYAGDPSVLFNFRGTFASPNFVIWLPCEIRSDGLGTLANTDARAQYRVNYTVDSSANFLSTGTVTAQVTLTITGHVEYWGQPEATDLIGTPQEQVPPLLGSTMFAVHETIASGLSNAAAVTAKHNRVGNQIRNFLYIVRTGAAATASEAPNPRADLFADPIRIRLDNRYIRTEAPNIRKARTARQLGMSGGFQTPGTGVSVVDTGVFAYLFSDGLDYHPSPGDDGGWLPTTEATFLQCEVTITGASGSANNITVLTNDVALRAAA
jgi:hypothetical protein